MGPLELTLPLDVWQVTLTSGDVVDVAAHSASEDAGYLVFKALMKGRPPFEITVAAFPASAVADWRGGVVFDGSLPYAGPPL